MRESELDALSRRKQAPESTLPALLEQRKLAELREIARQRGWQIKAGGKADYIAALSLLLNDATEVARAVTALPDDLRQALRAAFVAEEGNGIAPALLAQAMNATRQSEGEPWKPVEAAGLLHDLAQRGLVFPWHTFLDGLRYFFPWELQRQVPPLPGWCRQSPQAPSAHVLSRDRQDCIHVLFQVWERISQQSPTLRPPPEPPLDRRLLTILRGWTYDSQEVQEQLAKGVGRGERALQTLLVPPTPFLLTDAELEALAPSTDGDIEQLEFLCRLLLELDLVAIHKGHLIANKERTASFLRRPVARQCASVVHAYLSLLGWNELDLLLRMDPRLALQRNTYLPFTYDQLRSELLRLRHTILRFLATAGEEGWCLVTHVDGALRLFWPHFFPVPPAEEQEWWSHTFRSSWYLIWRHEQCELDEKDAQDWEAAQGAFLRMVLQGPLHWLGFVDLCQEDGELLACRLHGLGELLWDRPVAEPQEHPSGAPVALDEATRSIAVHPSIAPPEVHAFLGSIARLEEATPACFVYRLDMRTAYASFHRKSLSDLLMEWEKTMPLPIPRMIGQVLNDWWVRYGQVHLYEGLGLLEVNDELTLRELEASISLQQYILGRPAPNMLIVPDNMVEALLREFTAKGYTPREIR